MSDPLPSWLRRFVCTHSTHFQTVEPYSIEHDAHNRSVNVRASIVTLGKKRICEGCGYVNRTNIRSHVVYCNLSTGEIWSETDE